MPRSTPHRGTPDAGRPSNPLTPPPAPPPRPPRAIARPRTAPGPAPAHRLRAGTSRPLLPSRGAVAPPDGDRAGARRGARPVDPRARPSTAAQRCGCRRRGRRGSSAPVCQRTGRVRRRAGGGPTSAMGPPAHARVGTLVSGAGGGAVAEDSKLRHCSMHGGSGWIWRGGCYVRSPRLTGAPAAPADRGRGVRPRARLSS